MTVEIEVEEHTVPGDTRPFGLMVEEISVLVGSPAPDGRDDALATLERRSADLADDRDEVRASRSEGLIESLRRTALAHPDAVEEDFAAVRGPHSAALQNWLARHGADYDTVLIQGIPFDTIPRSVATLKAAAPATRVVTLPHFHGDDRFYHWRRYYDAFEAADTSLLFSEALGRQLKLDASFTVVPGGGVSLDELGDTAAGSAFRKAHRGTSPYFLVLGRKTASKGYERVVAAIGSLRRQGVTADLVLIGPDEDGKAVAGDGIAYLGRQPREVIRGALDGCVALVSMSTSESFGIVLCEAWLFGRPVIANRACQSFRDLVRDSETGLLAGTDGELEAAMTALLADPARAARMGAAGFGRVVKDFTWDKVAEACAGALLPEPAASPGASAPG